MDIIIKFIDNGIEYSLLNDKSNLIYQKLENGVITTELSFLEIKLIRDVLFSFLSFSEPINLGYISYNNNVFKHDYDVKNNFHYFNLKDSSLITDDILTLNYIFNHQEEYVAFKTTIKRKNKRYIRRNVKVKNKVLSVLVASLFLLTISTAINKSQEIKSSIFKNQYEKDIEIYDERMITFQEIETAIRTNPNLSEKEKNFLLSSPDFFYDNLEYFDYYTTLYYLSNLKIVYQKEDKGIVEGEFMPFDEQAGQINIYNASNFDEADKSILSHEFLHIFTTYSNQFNYLYEGINVVMNNDYFGFNEQNSIYDQGYEILRSNVYLLAELIDIDILRQYHANCDNELIIENLVKIIPDRTMAVNLLTDIDFVCRVVILKDKEPETYNSLKETLNLKRNGIKSSLKRYYETKYQTSIENDLYAFYWYDSKAASTKIAHELNFSLEEFLNADELTTIQRLKNIFCKNDDSHLVLSLANKVEPYNVYYTLSEVLEGKSGYLYRTKEEIDLKEVQNEIYEGVSYRPVSYISYEIPNINQKKNNLM